MDFRKILDPFWGFTLKTVPGICDISQIVIAFGTKNHETWGPPVCPQGCHGCQKSTKYFKIKSVELMR